MPLGDSKIELVEIEKEQKKQKKLFKIPSDEQSLQKNLNIFFKLKL